MSIIIYVQSKGDIKMSMKQVVLNDKVHAIVAKMWAKSDSTVKLSSTSKLGVNSWSLQALNTCPASLNDDGELVDACKGCYATSGNYLFPNVRAPREFNKRAWQNDSFINDFIDALDNERLFRWFDSGDMYSLQLAEKIYQIMKLTPHVRHWLPTRMYKFKKFHAIIKQMQALNNVVVRLSSDSINAEIVNSDIVDTNSTIVHESKIDNLGKSIKVCSAFYQDGKCLKCRDCYNKDIKTIAYITHGAIMKSQYKTKLINVVSV